MNSDIVEFLTARYDEIEAAARAATPGPWGTDPQFDEGFVTDSDGSYLVYSEGTVDIPTAAHIALHDPAYVLADIAAKRRLLAELVDVIDWARDYSRTELGTDESVTPLGRNNREWLRQGREGAYQHARDCVAERLAEFLALPFADHPDYKLEFRPPTGDGDKS